jgi:L-rhamnose mutarotase
MSKNGKVWMSESDLKRHLNLFNDVLDVYKDCEILEYDVLLANGYSIEEFCNDLE